MMLHMGVPAGDYYKLPYLITCHNNPMHLVTTNKRLISQKHQKNQKNNKTHPTPTSFPVSDAVTTSGPFNSLSCGLHPLEHGLPNSNVEFNSVASLGQVIPEANITIDTGPADVEFSSVASQDTGPSGSNFSGAPSFSSQWADT
jgi:hypothetical protein